jgi:hypothetical protein
MTEGSDFEPQEGQEFSLLYVIQTVSVVHPTSYSISTGDFSLGVKRQGHEAEHSTQNSAEVKKTWVYTSTPPYAFMT